MRFCILGSGSAGNCGLLRTGSTRVLVDAGFSARKTAQMLEAVGESLERIDGIFLTHEHGDHAACVAGLAKWPGIPIFANRATARTIESGLKHKPAWKIFETGSRFRFRDLEIESFSVPHDAQEPVGFSFTCGAADEGCATIEGGLFPAPQPRRLIWLTDLGYAPEHIHARVRAADIVVVESNHCAEMLKADTKRPWSLKQRISGRHGHLSNHSACELLQASLNPNWRHVFLTHLSRDCNSIDAVRTAFAPLLAHVNCPFSIVEPGGSTPDFLCP